MNILIINHYAGSPYHGMEFRPYYLGREWLKLGHRVLIAAASYSHLRSRQPSVGRHMRYEEIDGIGYRWYPAPEYVGNGVGRFINIVSFLFQVWRDRVSLMANFKPDVVLASSTYPMDVWVANSIARLSGAKFVFELHDLWPLSLIEVGGMSQYHPFVRICAVAERATYRKADLVVSILPEVYPHVTKMGLPAERLAVIPNGIDLPSEESPSDGELPDSIAAALDHADACQKYIVVYTGSHGMPNALDTLLDAASTLRDKPVLFILVGNGHERERLLRRVVAEKLSNVLMFPAVQKAQVPLLLKRADLAYLGAPRQSLYRFGVSPNKMIDYMAAGLPILFAVEAGNNPVLDANCGISVAAEDPSALAGAVCSMMRLPREQLDMLGRNGQRYVSDHHLYNVLARRFLEAVNRVDCRE